MEMSAGNLFEVCLLDLLQETNGTHIWSAATARLIMLLNFSILSRTFLGGRARELSLERAVLPRCSLVPSA